MRIASFSVTLFFGSESVSARGARRVSAGNKDISFPSFETDRNKYPRSADDEDEEEEDEDDE